MYKQLPGTYEIREEFHFVIRCVTSSIVSETEISLGHSLLIIIEKKLTKFTLHSFNESFLYFCIFKT